MKESYRLPGGGRICRDKPLSFSFNRRTYYGYEGDTLASALLANGVRTVGRSFKLHRRRGLLSAGAEESNALMSIGCDGTQEANVRATLQPLYQGLAAQSQNCWPSVEFDLAACVDWLNGLWTAGFYNKTFMWPNWHWYEGVIRRATGLGRLPNAKDPDHYRHQSRHCDLLVCGGGPAGIAAALAAAQNGARVVLADLDTEFGGGLLRSANSTEAGWLGDAMAALGQYEASGQVTLLTRATVSGFFDHNVLLVSQRLDQGFEDQAHTSPREILWKLRAREVVIATGAIEQPLVFANNDRPGIMLASAVQHYLNRYAVTAGRRVVVATNNGSAYDVVQDLCDAGVRVVALVDSRASGDATRILKLEALGVRVFQHWAPIDSHGRKAIKSVTLARRKASGAVDMTDIKRLACDCLALSGGWQPAIHLLSQARGSLRYDAEITAFVPDRVPDHVQVVGGANAAMTIQQAIEEGRQAGQAASAQLANDSGRTKRVSAIGLDQAQLGQAKARAWQTDRVSISHKPHRQWLDFQHDVTRRDVSIAVQENYHSVEHVKRYTTAGMSVDQGKTGNINVLHLLAELTDRPVPKVGTTTFRPFYMPVTLGVLAARRAGDFYAPIKRSPLHAVHQQLQAELIDYSHWQRPAAYPRACESLAQAIQREVVTVRRSVGIFDASPLGKIEVRGADAAEFLNRLYVNNVTSLAVGRARYGLMLNENGIIIDDGIFVRLADRHFLVHTTSGNAGMVYAWMEEWLQTEWPELEVMLTPVTTQWANITLSGPQAREVLQRTGVDIDLSAEAFPHMHFREGKLEGTPVRVMRASFTGELGYEVNIPADYVVALWQRLMAVGEDFDITPYGIESLMVLRTEKGFLHVGADTDGATTAADVGWSPIIAKKPVDFIGKRSLLRPHNVNPDRLQLVGVQLPQDARQVVVGAHILNAAQDVTAVSNSGSPQRIDAKPASASQGYITSAAYSPHLEHWVALALVSGGSQRLGEQVKLFHAGRCQPATLVAPAFYDTQGERIHA